MNTYSLIFLEIDMLVLNSLFINDDLNQKDVRFTSITCLKVNIYIYIVNYFIMNTWIKKTIKKDLVNSNL